MTMETAMTATAIQNIRTRQEWAEVINEYLRKSIEGFIQTGRALIAAREELPDGEWGKMIKADLPFSISTADRFMTIARHPAIAGCASMRNLPPNWTVLAPLASLTAEDFEDAQDRGLINADTSQRKAIAIKGAYKTPVGKSVGEGRAVSNLPSPKEAREVARATSRMVAASDGNLYSGATEEEGAEHIRLRTQSYSVIDAINTIADIGVSPKQWCEEAREHWLNRFEFGRIENAQKWLEQLRLAFMRQKRIYDCKAEADGE